MLICKPSSLLAITLLMVPSVSPLHAQTVKEEPLPKQSLRIGRSDANTQGNAVTAICVDQAQPAWTLIYGVLPQDKARPCARGDMKRVKQGDFPALQRRLRDGLLHEVQPESDVAARVMALARQQPGMPIGLTWDGGMAITATDYRAAEKRLAAYRADPQGYAAMYWRPAAGR